VQRLAHGSALHFHASYGGLSPREEEMKQEEGEINQEEGEVEIN